jgi:hypothetical protein
MDDESQDHDDDVMQTDTTATAAATTGKQPVKLPEPLKKGPKDEPLADPGGASDCSWRAIAFAVAINKGKKGTRIQSKTASMGAAVRGTTIKWLRENNDTWETKWAPDPAGQQRQDNH